MKKIVLKVFLCTLALVLTITAFPPFALALSEKEQEDIYRVDEFWQDEYRQMYIEWLLESDNFVYHLDVAKERVLFKNFPGFVNIDPIKRKENYIQILASFIELSYDELRRESKKEVLDELTVMLLEKFGEYMESCELTVQQFNLIENAIFETSDYYLSSYYGIDTDMGVYGYNAIYERIQSSFDGSLSDLEWSDGKEIVMDKFYDFVDSNEWQKSLGAYSKLFEGIGAVTDVYKEGLALLGEIESYSRADEKLVRFVKYVQSTASDGALRAACDELYKKFGLNYGEYMIGGLLDIAVNTTLKWTYEALVDKLVEVLGVGGIFAKIGIIAGQIVADQWFNTSDTVKYMQTIYCINELSELLTSLVREELDEREALSQTTSAYSARHASELIYHMKLLITLRRKGEECYFKLKETVYSSDIVNVIRTFGWGNLNQEAVDINDWYTEFSNTMLGVENRLYMFIPLEEYLDRDMLPEGSFIVEDGVLVKYIGDDKHVSIPAGVHTVGKGAFAYNSSIKSIELPVSVAHIKSGAFDSCSELTSVTAVAFAMVIETDSFVNCNNRITMYGYEGSALQIYAENNDISFVAIKYSFNDSLDLVENDFEIEDGVLKKYNGLSEVVYIPLGVTEIGEGAFRDCEFLRDVIISGSVKKIGYSAFNGCEVLGSIEIPSNVTEIDAYAFSGCAGLKEVKLSYGLESIGAYSFESCVNLESIIIPDSVTYLGDRAFMYCSGMRSAVVGDCVDNINEFTFHHCDSLESITIGKSVRKIGYSSFNSCSSLVEVTLPSSIETIESYAFADCTLLERIDLNDGLNVIDSYAFEGCEGLKEIIIPDSVTVLGDRAFFKCKGMKRAVIGGGVSNIGDHAFNGCEELDSLTVKNGVTVVGYCAFKDCESLVEITLPSSVEVIESYAFDSCTSLEKINLNYGLREISNYAFSGCERLEGISVPDSVVNIGDSAFLGCTSIKKAVIGDGVVNIGRFAFNDCTDLSEVILGEGLEYIGTSAFRGCERLVCIDIPDSINTIGSYAFAECIGLVRVSLGEKLANIEDSAFDGCHKLIEVCNRSSLKISAGSGDHGGVALYADYVYRPSNGESRVTFVNDYLFYAYNDTEYFMMGYKGYDFAISLPSKINGEEYYLYPCAFYNNDSLLSITVPECILGIGAGAFYSCDNLMRIIFCGTEEEWDAVPKGERWNDGIPGNVIFHNYNNEGICGECGHKKKNETEVLLGDVNGDGYITNADVLEIYRYIYNQSMYPLNVEIGDVTRDGLVTNSDVLIIYRYIYNPTLYPIE